jgi:hypothetical protein
VALVGCTLQEEKCDEGGRVVVEIAAARVTEDGSVRFEGTGRSELDTAIRSIQVAGEEASLDDFNFSRFSVSVPANRLPARGARGSCAAGVDEASICLSVRVDRACGIAQLEHHVVRIVGGLDTQLTAIVRPRSVLPADGSSPLEIELRSDNGFATDATLRLVTPAGGSGAAEFDAVGGGTTTELFVDPVALTTVVGVSPGSLTLEVSAPSNPTQTALLTVAGPPRIAPRAGSIPRDASLSVTIESEASLDRCQSFGGTVDVEGADASIGVDLSASSAAGTIQMSGASTSVVLRCWDQFGQRSEARFDLST